MLPGMNLLKNYILIHSILFGSKETLNQLQLEYSQVSDQVALETTQMAKEHRMLSDDEKFISQGFWQQIDYVRHSLPIHDRDRFLVYDHEYLKLLLSQL